MKNETINLLIFIIVAILVWEFLFKEVLKIFFSKEALLGRIKSFLKSICKRIPRFIWHICATELSLIPVTYVFVHIVAKYPFHAEILLGEVVTTLIIAIAINLDWKFFIQPMKDMTLWQNDFAKSLKKIENSPIGKYISVASNQHTRELAFAVNRLLENASLSSPDQEIVINKAEEVIRVIGRRLSPDMEVQDDINSERTRFGEVERGLRNYTKQARFTDIRSPGLWDLDNNLHKFTLAAVESFRGRNGNGATYVITKPVEKAIVQCIDNFDNLLIEKQSSLSHCRRWIGCPYLNSDLNVNLDKKIVASCLFHGIVGDLDNCESMVNKIKRMLRKSMKCDDASCQYSETCIRVNFELAGRLSINDLEIKSIFDKSNLNAPGAYWHTGLRTNQNLTEVLNAQASVQVEVKEVDEDDLLDYCRILFWKKEYLDDEEAQLRLWDNHLGVPLFWIDVNDGIFNINERTQLLKSFFITQNRDYIFLKKSATNVVAYYTNVQKDRSISEKLTLEKQSEFQENFDEVLNVLGVKDERSKDKALLAAHARFLYKNKI